MIDENFLQSAVRIRRNYLKLTSNMNVYKKQADNLTNYLEDCLDKINKLSEKLEQTNNSENSNSEKILELMNLLNRLTKETEDLETYVNPINSDIEKLAVEEQELYERIKEKHSNLTEEQIVESVRQRLIQENIA